jgi:DNA (cytosine-5)-methyltransferase 1
MSAGHTPSKQLLKHIDLFSGIGGFSIGFEREGIETIAFVESDAGCRTVLESRWPSVPTWGDIRDFSGLPMSGHQRSWAAQRAVRLEELADVRPSWVVVENSHHTWRRWVPELRRRLYGCGFSSVCFRVRASEVGAWHERARAFVVAHADCEQLRKLSRWWSGPGREVAKELAQSRDSAPGDLGMAYGLPNGAYRRHALGNAVYPPAAQLIARGIRSVS